MDEESLMDVVGEEEEEIEDDEEAADTETEDTPAPAADPTPAVQPAVPVAAAGQGDPPAPGERRTLTGQLEHQHALDTRSLPSHSHT